MKILIYVLFGAVSAVSFAKQETKVSPRKTASEQSVTQLSVVDRLKSLESESSRAIGYLEVIARLPNPEKDIPKQSICYQIGMGIFAVETLALIGETHPDLNERLEKARTSHALLKEKYRCM